ncbi:hypothetical protein M8J77_008421 [Diaphorina citri]|nr:hypothetical protein M8J77_008421 [Diaphorina citri]
MIPGKCPDYETGYGSGIAIKSLNYGNSPVFLDGANKKPTRKIKGMICVCSRTNQILAKSEAQNAEGENRHIHKHQKKLHWKLNYIAPVVMNYHREFKMTPHQNRFLERKIHLFVYRSYGRRSCRGNSLNAPAIFSSLPLLIDHLEILQRKRCEITFLYVDLETKAYC